MVIYFVVIYVHGYEASVSSVLIWTLPVSVLINVINNLVQGNLCHVLRFLWMFKVHVLVSVHLPILVLVRQPKLTLHLMNSVSEALEAESSVSLACKLLGWLVTRALF